MDQVEPLELPRPFHFYGTCIIAASIWADSDEMIESQAA